VTTVTHWLVCQKWRGGSLSKQQCSASPYHALGSVPWVGFQDLGGLFTYTLCNN
jgi:hypothetical protein